MQSETTADVATAVALGRRDRQEDAVAAQFTEGADTGFAILSDGMGGHDDGDLAARIIVSEVFGAISLSDCDGPPEPSGLRDRLRRAVESANCALRDGVVAGLGQEGMGGTVVTAIVQDDALSWISVGDSALYLYRDGQLRRLNEIHSLAPQIDLMAARGEIDAETARDHPQRSCLTSALVGAGINRVDCPEAPLELRIGDIVLLASDGLEVLDEEQIRESVQRHHAAPSKVIARALLRAVEELDAQDQDNVSVIVIKPHVAQAAFPNAATGRLSASGFLPDLRKGLVDLRQTVTALLTGQSA
ncbi:PP2C family protein-serine/threonine phosphatase [Aestuariicoccus sp. MJ-SS9]|uniref:PP2C family protein-serine/threonine phosphatase n=1 Tax=Aestuariicoccus sp. MJ-SS9 TaxID=3079855 RepID=UPI0029153FFA|nr:protein phosphatase 2C domain-containing protein [Aestuariicoccus sp. MJ-SS9]MDU8913555.1 protein phosphatase 2C domain-containing protein [Aestuariicoccus sp. MJ-SS9]